MSAVHELDAETLLPYLEAHVEGFRGPLDIEKFAGGQSNPTFKLTAGSGVYVLRRQPPGKLLKSAHAVDREFRVISALYGDSRWNWSNLPATKAPRRRTIGPWSS